MENNDNPSKTPEQQAFEQALKDAVTMRMPFGICGVSRKISASIVNAEMSFAYSGMTISLKNGNAAVFSAENPVAAASRKHAAAARNLR